MTRIGSISSSNPTKTILHAVSGHAAPGQVLACLGPSGAGKTSVLSVLSGRSTYQEGTIRINDKVLTKRELKKLQAKIAYVKQNDVFFDHLTVRDQLTYTALLRLPKWMSRTEKHMQVEMNIRQLRLEQVVQSPIMMISGGERKRVNIATELLTHPMIVLLDEPTSKKQIRDNWKATYLVTMAFSQCCIISFLPRPFRWPRLNICCRTFATVTNTGS
jgi:ABC-type multidrug transport system ATPase subunit